MLISCPKCRSIYEIPDDLIGKTGKNLRCQACNNVWHAMVEDTLGYQKNKSEKPFIEGIEVAEPPYRNYPSNKENFSVPLDNPDSNVKPSIPSSFDIVNKEGGVVDIRSGLDLVTEILYKGDSFVEAGVYTGIGGAEGATEVPWIQGGGTLKDPVDGHEMSATEAIAFKMVEKALSGDSRAATFCMQLQASDRLQRKHK